MPRKKIRKRVSELLNFERDIEPNGVTAIWAGVGSGKNTFIEGLHKTIVHDDGTEERIDVKGIAENHRVLLITSRTAKVTETESRHAEDYLPYLTDIRDLDNWDLDEYDNKSYVCTSAHIKERIIKDYSPLESEQTLFWNRFEYIIIDEFHSLVTDATFSDTAYIMKCFIDKVYDDCIKGKPTDKIKPKLIFMSGTPYTTKKLISNFEYTEHNLLEGAIFVKPKKINFTYYKDSLKSIIYTLKHGGTVVYYMCCLDKLDELIETAKSIGIDETQIAVSVSDTDTKRKLKADYKETIYKNIAIVESHLSEKMTLPENIKFFITNSKNKEGINIETSPDLLVLEQHYHTDIVQICGRFRNGVDYVEILHDAKQFTLPLSYSREEEYQRAQGLYAANQFFNKLIAEKDIDLTVFPAYSDKSVVEFIEYIEKSTPFIRFNPFTNSFEMNDCYIQARKDYYTSLSEFMEFMQQLQYNQVTFAGGFYDGIKLIYTPIEEPYYLLQDYLKKNGWALGETIFTPKQEKKLLRELNRLRNDQPKVKYKEYKKLGHLLKFFGCEKKPTGRTENGEFYIVLISETN